MVLIVTECAPKSLIFFLNNLHALLDNLRIFVLLNVSFSNRCDRSRSFLFRAWFSQYRARVSEEPCALYPQAMATYQGIDITSFRIFVRVAFFVRSHASSSSIGFIFSYLMLLNTDRTPFLTSHAVSPFILWQLFSSPS